MTETQEREFSRLHRLIKHRDIAAIRTALDAGANADMANRYGLSLLMIAAASGNVVIGELLLANGADPNRARRHGLTALALAVISGHVPFLKLLLEHAADPNCAPDGIPIQKMIRHCGFAPSKEAAIFTLLSKYGGST